MICREEEHGEEKQISQSWRPPHGRRQSVRPQRPHAHCRRLAWLERGKRNHRPVQEKNKQCRKSENNINLTTAIAGRDPIRRCINFASVPSPPDEDLSKGIGALGQEEVFRHPQ